MFRSHLAALGLAAALLAWPSISFPDDTSALPPPAPEQEASDDGQRDAGDVSVDLGEATPGLTPELFESTLSQHGDWHVSARYGKVWRPRTAIGWRPYYYGQWLWSDEGWYWDSDEPFAWAAYHYGRWVYDPAWGWVWVPGYQWAPAWVTWRIGVDAIGWAPLGPGISVYVTAYPFVDVWWTFVPTVRFVGVPVHSVAYGPRETHRWFRSTSAAPPRTTAPPRDGRPVRAAAPAWGGPSRRSIEDRIGRPVESVRSSPASGPARRWERDRAPGGLRSPDRGAPRERPDARPAPRGGWERPESIRPAPRGDEVRRPSARPAPRGDEERRSSARPAPRSEEGSQPSWKPPARSGGERKRSRDRNER